MFMIIPRIQLIAMTKQELLDLLGIHRREDEEIDDSVLQKLDRGLHHTLDAPPRKRTHSATGQQCDGKEWLLNQCKEFNDLASSTADLTLPLKINTNGTSSEYTVEDLYDDQKQVVAVVLDKILEWTTCTDLKNFKPLRLTINGPGGTGKTVVMNTIVTLLRKMFNNNDVIKVCAPTGTAAFNAGGETVHHLMENRAGIFEYDAFSMDQSKKNKLTAKLKDLICLIIDERSLLDAAITGVTEQMMSETLFNGSLSHHDWGHIPVLIFVGDDYQLPSITTGAFDCFEKKGGNKTVTNGRQQLQKAAEVVMSLTASKRINDKQKMDKEIIRKTRTAEELEDSEINKLLNLHLTNIQAKHGPTVVNDIKKKQYIFSTETTKGS